MRFILHCHKCVRFWIWSRERLLGKPQCPHCDNQYFTATRV